MATAVTTHVTAAANTKTQVLAAGTRTTVLVLNRGASPVDLFFGDDELPGDRMEQSAIDRPNYNRAVYAGESALVKLEATGIKGPLNLWVTVFAA